MSTRTSRAPHLALVHTQHPTGRHLEAGHDLVDAAVAELCTGHTPRRSIRVMAELGTGSRPLGQDAATVLDVRLARALSGWAADYHRSRTVGGGWPVATPVLHSRGIADALFSQLSLAAVLGCPHPGPWYPSSVDEVPCVVHGEEDDAVDCLRMLVQAHLAETLDRAGRDRALPAGGGTITEQVEVAHGSRSPRSPLHPDLMPSGEHAAVAALWLGVATLAAWQEHACS